MINSDVGSYEIVLLPDDHISNLIRQSGRPYEPKLLAVARELTKPGESILDIGANLGNHTIYWAKAGRRVMAFEPNPMTRSALAGSVSRNKLGALVDIFPVALGATAGTGALRALRDGNQGAIAVEPAASGEIPIARLDDLDMPAFSVMKIDVEGAEESVLVGAHDAISRFRPFIIAEALGNKGGVADLLHGLGYHRVPVSLAFTPTYLYAPSRTALLGLVRSRTMVRRLLLELARRLHIK
jgi:FkbM family methyltransferase